METIHELSSLAPLPELDLFSVPTTQTSIDRDVYTEYRPISVLDSRSTITFVIPTASDEYLQMREMMLYMEIRFNLKQTNDVQQSDWEKVSVVNNLLHSLFRQVEVEVNNKVINDSPPTYSYKSYFDTLLHFSKNAQKTQLSGALWDTAALATAEQNKISTTRSEYIRPAAISKDGKGKVIGLMGKLNIDLASQERALIGGSHLRITLTPHDRSFYMMGTDNATVDVEFLKASLFVHRSKVSPLVRDAHLKALDHATAKYPFARREVKAFNISAGATSAQIDNAVLGILPRRVFLAMVDNRSYAGNIKMNPYYFHHYNVTQLAVHADGMQHPSTAYSPNFQTSQVAREYMGFLEALNEVTSDTAHGVSMEEWKSTPIFGFNLAPDLSEGIHGSGHVNRVRRGPLSINLKFSQGLANTVTILLYCEYDSLLQINKEGSVTVD